MAALQDENFNKKCKIIENAELGRYVVAATNIKPGETVLLEPATIIVPNAGDRRCTNCHQLTTAFCSKCKILPLCATCTEHSAQDCAWLTKLLQLQHAEKQLKIDLLQAQPDIYGALRWLLMLQHEERRAECTEMLQMEAHMAERRDTEIWQNYAQKVVQPLIESGLLDLLNKESGNSGSVCTVELNADLLQRFHGILDVNIHEIRAPEPNASMRGLYLRGALFAHSCLPNLVTAIDEEYRLKVYANRNIAAGEMLYNCYANVLLGTEERQQALKSGKYFLCTCVRCADPTELGSHMSTFLCTSCQAANLDGGYIVKQPETGIWQCQLNAAHTLKADYVASMLERAKEECHHAREDIYRCELLLAKLSQIFHRNHYVLLDLKQNIAAFLRQVLQNMSQTPGRKVYERKIQLCQEILLVLKDIQPGISRLKAIALYELSNTQAELGRKLYGERVYSAADLLLQLQQTEFMLRESLRMLLYEPLGSAEGILARNMLKELKDLQNDIKILQEQHNKNEE